MDRQTIICISREFGSGGRVMAQKIATDLGLPLYDRNLLDEIARERGILNADSLKEYDERPRNPLLSRRVRGYSSSMEDAVAEMQFHYLRQKADSGASFVVVGRCSEWVLKGRKNVISVFVTGDWDTRIQRIMDVYHVGRTEAVKKTKRHDKHRRYYHDTYCDFKWGHAHGYDLVINSSRLGIEGTTEMLEKYIGARTARNHTN